MPDISQASMQQPTPNIREHEILRRIDDETSHMQIMPQVATQALELAKDPDVSVTDITDLICTDLKLTADLMRIANSTLYSFGRPTAKLEVAVARLGFNQCRNLMMASGLSTMLSEISLKDAWVRELLWQHSLMTGCMATRLNRELQVGLDGDEFMAGLMHDIGRILLAMTMPEEFDRNDKLTFDESDATVMFEIEGLGVSHAQIGAHFAQNQGLPDSIVETVLLHHEPWLATVNPEQSALIQLADELANCQQRESDENQFSVDTSKGIELLQSLGVPNIASRLTDVMGDVIEKSLLDVEELSSN